VTTCLQRLFISGALMLATSIFLLPVALAVPVCYVQDGNTFLTCDGRTIRIEGVQAPSLTEPYGVQSRDFLIQQIQNKDVTLTIPTSYSLQGVPGYSMWTPPNGCYVPRFTTITNQAGQVIQQYQSMVPCQDLVLSQQPVSSGVMNGPINVAQHMVSQGWARDTSGQYKTFENLARGLRLGIWH
jgi:hypothetical protein